MVVAPAVAASQVEASVPGLPLLGTGSDDSSGEQHKELECPGQRYRHKFSTLLASKNTIHRRGMFAHACYKGLVGTGRSS